MLRLVSDKEPKHGDVVSFSAAESEARSARELRAEAAAIEMQHGRNAYSSFLSKYGRRPDPAEAATIGRLIGARVMASDGTMHPPISKDQKRSIAAERKKTRTEVRRDQQVLRLRRAILDLSSNAEDPSALIGSIGPKLDSVAICEQLDTAVSWLNRFAEEWRNRVQEQH